MIYHRFPRLLDSSVSLAA